jgi:hypothetical protein
MAILWVAGIFLPFAEKFRRKLERLSMKTPIRAVKGRKKVAGPPNTSRSNTGQIDRTEIEDTTLSDSEPPTEKRTVHKNAETTVLERRVLAHERILQSLIAHMTETEPRFLERLQKTFHIQIKFHEQDYTDTEDFASAFVRAVEEAVFSQRTKVTSQASAAERVRAVPKKQGGDAERAKPAGFQIKNRNGIWEVTENGLFYGHYFREQLAKDAVRNGNLR